MSGKEKRKNIPDIDVALVTAHSYVNMIIFTHIAVPAMGTHIFSQSMAGPLERVLVLTALEKVLTWTDAEDISIMLNKLVNTRNSSSFVHTYMDRARGRIHDNILSKFSNTFFSALPSANPLSSNSCATFARRRDYAREIDGKSDYYRSLNTPHHG